MRISSYSFILILLKLHRCFGHGLKICMWFRYNPQIIVYYFFCKLNLVIFQALLLSTYVDSMYLVRVTPLMNFTFSDDSLFLKKNLGGGHKFSEFACLFFLIQRNMMHMERVEVDAHTIYIPLRIDSRI